MASYADAVEALHIYHARTLRELELSLEVARSDYELNIRAAISGTLPPSHPLAPVAEYVADAVRVVGDGVTTVEQALAVFRAAVVLMCGCNASGDNITDYDRNNPFTALAVYDAGRAYGCTLGLRLSALAPLERNVWRDMVERVKKVRGQAAVLPARPTPPDQIPTPTRDLDMPPPAKRKRKAKENEQA